MDAVRFCVNGKMVSGISPTNRGLAYGDGVFRTMRLVDGQLLDWPLHYQTLVADCGKIHLVCPSAELLMQEFKYFMAAAQSDASAAVIKLIITRGEGARGYAPPAVCEPSRIFIQSAMPQYPAALYTQGVALYLCQTRLAAQPLLAGIKHLNRLENVLARAEQKDPRFFDGLLRDYEDHVIEAVSGNLFIKVGGQVITPDLSRCGVAGVMRQKVLDWYKTQGQPVTIRPVFLPEVLQADAVIIVNSIYGVLQVVQIDDHPMMQNGWAAALRSSLSDVTTGASR